MSYISKIKNNKSTFIWSILIGAYLTLSINFLYVNPQDFHYSLLPKFISDLQQWLDGYGFINSLMAVFLSAFSFFTLLHIKAKKEKFRIFLSIISLIFGSLNVFGLMMYNMDDLPFFDSQIWLVITIFLIIGWATLFYLLAHWILFGFDQLSEKTENQIETHESHKKESWFIKKFNAHPFVTSFVVILLCWTPWVLAYYPASMDWDVYRQISSTMSIGWFTPSNHHPWISSWIITQFYKFGLLIGNKDIGIFTYVCLRNIAVAAIYAYSVNMLKKSNLKNWLSILTLLYYSVTPVWGAYAKHAFKDTFATGLFCAYFIFLITIIVKAKNRNLKAVDCLMYSLATFATAIFRNNPIYAIIPGSILLAIFLISKKQNWKKVTLLFLGILLYFGSNYYAFNYANIQQGSSAEALSIPFQQTARTVKYHGDEITPEERENIDNFLVYDTMGDVYDPLISDPIKDHCKLSQNGDDAGSNYLKTWFSMFFKYPDTYIEATIGNSYGYYAFTPKLPFWAGNWNSGMTIFEHIEVEPFASWGLDFKYPEFTKTARDALHQYAKLWDSLPILSLTDTIAAYTWFIVLVFYDFLRKRKWGELIPVVILGILILTCIASPVNDCFRYYSIVAVAVPLLPVLISTKSVYKKSKL